MDIPDVFVLRHLDTNYDVVAQMVEVIVDNKEKFDEFLRDNVVDIKIKRGTGKLKKTTKVAYYKNFTWNDSVNHLELRETGDPKVKLVKRQILQNIYYTPVLFTKEKKFHYTLYNCGEISFDLPPNSGDWETIVHKHGTFFATDIERYCGLGDATEYKQKAGVVSTFRAVDTRIPVDVFTCLARTACLMNAQSDCHIVSNKETILEVTERVAKYTLDANEPLYSQIEALSNVCRLSVVALNKNHEIQVHIHGHPWYALIHVELSALNDVVGNDKNQRDKPGEISHVFMKLKDEGVFRSVFHISEMRRLPIQQLSEWRGGDVGVISNLQNYMMRGIKSLTYDDNKRNEYEKHIQKSLAVIDIKTADWKKAEVDFQQYKNNRLTFSNLNINGISNRPLNLEATSCAEILAQVDLIQDIWFPAILKLRVFAFRYLLSSIGPDELYDKLSEGQNDPVKKHALVTIGIQSFLQVEGHRAGRSVYKAIKKYLSLRAITTAGATGIMSALRAIRWLASTSWNVISCVWRGGCAATLWNLAVSIKDGAIRGLFMFLLEPTSFLFYTHILKLTAASVCPAVHMKFMRTVKLRDTSESYSQWFSRLYDSALEYLTMWLNQKSLETAISAMMTVGGIAAVAALGLGPIGAAGVAIGAVTGLNSAATQLAISFSTKVTAIFTETIRQAAGVWLFRQKYSNSVKNIIAVFSMCVPQAPVVHFVVQCKEAGIEDTNLRQLWEQYSEDNGLKQKIDNSTCVSKWEPQQQRVWESLKSGTRTSEDLDGEGIVLDLIDNMYIGEVKAQWDGIKAHVNEKSSDPRQPVISILTKLKDKFKENKDGEQVLPVYINDNTLFGGENNREIHIAQNDIQKYIIEPLERLQDPNHHGDVEYMKLPDEPKQVSPEGRDTYQISELVDIETIKLHSPGTGNACVVLGSNTPSFACLASLESAQAYMKLVGQGIVRWAASGRIEAKYSSRSETGIRGSQSLRRQAVPDDSAQQRSRLLKLLKEVKSTFPNLYEEWLTLYALTEYNIKEIEDELAYYTSANQYKYF